MAVPASRLLVLGFAGLLLAGTARASTLVNGTFVDLTGWTTSSVGVIGVPGTVATEDGWLVLTEGDALLTRAEQTFLFDGTEDFLRFEVGLVTGFDGVDAGFSDAFEVHLLDGLGETHVAPWRDGATAALSIQQDGTILAADDVVVVEDPDQPLLTVSLDLDAIPAGSQVTLAFVLVGGDAGTTSQVRVRDVQLTNDILVPPADTGHTADTAAKPDTGTRPTGDTSPDTGDPQGDTSSRPTGDTNPPATGDTADPKKPGTKPTATTATTAETGRPLGPTGETATPEDTQPEDTSPPTEPDPTEAPDGNLDDVDAGDPKKEGCGCQSPTPSAGWLLLLLPLLRRRRALTTLALLAAVLVGAPEASAQALDFDGLPEVPVNAPLQLSGFDEVELGVVTVADGQRLQLAFTGGGINGFTLTNRHGRTVADQDDDALEPVRLMAGSYLVSIQPGGNTTAILRAFDDSATSAVLDTPATGTIDVEGSEHRFVLDATADRYVVRGTGPWHVENAEGRTVHEAGQGAFDLQVGTYDLVVGDAAFTGAYDLTWSIARASVPLTLGTPVVDTLAVGDVHAFTYTATAGEQVELAGVPADVRVLLTDPLGTPVADTLGGLPLPWTLGAGDHRIELVHEGTSDAPYTVTLSTTVIPPSGLVLDDVGPLTPGVPLDGGVAAPSVGHEAQLVVATPTTYAFDVQAVSWTLRDPHGQARPDSGPTQLDAGTWTLEVVPPSLPSPYSLLVQEVPELPIVLGASTDVTLTAAEAEHAYVFDLPNAGRLRIVPDGSTADLAWRLEDVDGALWSEGSFDDDIGVGLDVTAGAYRFVVARSEGVDPVAEPTASVEVALAETFDEVVQLGDERQGAFVEAHGYGTYRVVVPEDDTPFQVSVIRTFSYSSELSSTYVDPVPFRLAEPYGVEIRALDEADSGTHSEIWVLDAGTYDLEIGTRQNRFTDAFLETEWDVKVRGLTAPTEELWFGHDDNVFGELNPIFSNISYGISRMGVAPDGSGGLQVGAVEDVFSTNWIWSLMWAPDGDAVFTQESLDRIVKVDVETGLVEHDLPIGVRATLVPDPSGLKSPSTPSAR